MTKDADHDSRKSFEADKVDAMRDVGVTPQKSDVDGRDEVQIGLRVGR